MATVTEKNELREKLAQYEGSVDHMYLDTKGFVTIGIGHFLKDVSAAQKISFIHQEASEKATADEIKTDFENVKKQAKGLFASLYKKYTKLKITKSTIDTLTDKHIDTFESELERVYGSAKFSAYPSEVRLALFDMIFNLGMTNLRTKFPAFNKHIKANNWSDAAKESKRRDVGAERNQYVKDLLEKAAKAKKP